MDPDTIRELAELMRSLGVLGIFNALREEAATDDRDVTLGAFVPSANELSSAFATLGALERRGYPILNSHTHLE